MGTMVGWLEPMGYDKPVYADPLFRCGAVVSLVASTVWAFIDSDHLWEILWKIPVYTFVFVGLWGMAVGGIRAIYRRLKRGRGNDRH
ncbi:hypothetical protein EV642_121101 [Kribbella sp. VKM Ac-2500]|uniref:hypothetical protein n=1 Tax=Kribbella sp. VKM Ac-2500 TaxID=2512214 RepID=UPI00104DCAC0|nr:hypothetical protein [Kribbella sp. VKM Ac-2500]TCN34464.1 hypothetical protein EV642_121101 [Kribbella sp. VKM Ac-2500]